MAKSRSTSAAEIPPSPPTTGGEEEKTSTETKEPGLFDGLLDFAFGSMVGEADDAQLDVDDDTDEEDVPDDDSTDDMKKNQSKRNKETEKDPSKKEKKTLFGRGRFGKKSAAGTTTAAAAAAAVANNTDASTTKASAAAAVEASTEAVSKDKTVDHEESAAPACKSVASNTPSKKSLFRRRNKKAAGTTKDTPENEENKENDHRDDPAFYSSMVGAAAAIGIAGTAATATAVADENNKQNETEDGNSKDNRGMKKLSTNFRNKFRKHGKVHGASGNDEDEEEKTTDSNALYSFWAPQDETKVEPIEARQQDAEASSKLTKKRPGIHYEGKKIKAILGDLKKHEEQKENVDSDGEPAGRSNKTSSEDEGTDVSCMPTRKDYNDAMMKFDTEYLPKMAMAMLCLVPAEESVELGYQKGSKRRERRSRSRRARFEEDEQ